MTASPPGAPKTAKWGWGILFAGFAMLYSLTAARGIQWQDSGHFVLRIVTGELVNPLGLALAHPAHYWLGLACVGLMSLEPPFAVALLSALFGAVAVSNLYGCVLCLTGRHLASGFAAVSFGLAHTMWRMATVPECYTITVALLGAEFWALAVYGRTGRSRALVWMMLFNGLGLANHNLALLTLPVVGVVLVGAWRRGRIGASGLAVSVGAWIAGSLPYTALVVVQIFDSGEMGATLTSALVGNYSQNVLSTDPGARQLVVSIAFTGLCFPSLLLPLAALGLVRGRRGGLPGVVYGSLLVALAIHLLFVVRYPVVDQHTFFLPSYLLLCVFGGLGFAAVGRLRRPAWRRALITLGWALLLLTPAVYAVVPPVARYCDVLATVERHKPYRDDYAYLFLPWSVRERSAERMSRHAVALAGDDGLILAQDPMGAFALRYQSIRRGTPAMTLVEQWTESTIREAVDRGRAVVLVPHDVGKPLDPPPQGTWRREGDLYVLEP